MKYIHEMDMSSDPLLQTERGYSQRRIATSASTQVLTGAGVLKGISFNKRSPGSVSVYDSTSAVSSALIGVFDSSTVVRVAELNIRVAKGILVVAAVTGGDYTVIYRAD